jgi:class 3 adenylate cyclase
MQNDAATRIPPNSESYVDAERRQVTVLFTDMVGFTIFSERSGEEAAYTLMRSLSKLMGEAVREQGGVVRGFTGDGIMAVFGAPVAYEDAPLRACRAALSILERLKAAAPGLEAKHGVQPQMRIGLNTGPAVVGQVEDGAGAEVTVLGDTVNFAARLQALAEPDSVFLSETTHHLLQGMVNASFAGEHRIKGKSESQKLYRLDSLRPGATRFSAAVTRGLSNFVGRERELQVLEQEFDKASSGLCVCDIVAEPGMGKSRLLYEFRRRIEPDRAIVLAGSCSSDGQQTPFFPFIEVVRGAFNVRTGEAGRDVAQKLEIALKALGLYSVRNIGLLLHLLGLNVPSDALTDLDGALIGVRTRELLQQLLATRCRLSVVVMLVEDLHWIDSASEQVLGDIVGSETNLKLLLLTSRRREYTPTWLDRPGVARFNLEPLPAKEVRRLVQSRLGVESISDGLAQRLTDKAEGNPLFAEEIVTFLIERGIVRTAAGKLEFDASALGEALPSSVQSLLAARVDRLAAKDRILLQAASVIGRRFDPALLAAATEELDDIDGRLATMQAHDLVHVAEKAGDYVFKHALVRDALYQSLLAEARRALHLKIAQEIERRSGNRMTEVAETLARHYSQTDRADKAFTYLAMAGAKGLAAYSFEEADSHFAAAIALLDKHPESASNQQVADLLVDYTLYLDLSIEHRPLTQIVERFMPRLDRAGDSHQRVLVQHHFTLALLWTGRYHDALKAQRKLSEMAGRLHDARSSAYALASEIHLSTVLEPKPAGVFDEVSREALAAAANINDPYLQCFLRWAVGWDEFHRGHVTKAHRAAEELLTVGRHMNDPRSIGFAMHLQSWIAIISDDYAGALNFADIGMSMARTRFDKEGARNAKIAALLLLRRPEAFAMIRDFKDVCAANAWHWHTVSTDAMWAVALVLDGQIGRGLRWMLKSIARRDREGYRFAADWYRMNLSEIYLEIISGKDKPPPKVLARNVLTLAVVILTAQKRISVLVEQVRRNPHLDPAGHFSGRCEMILGLLHKAKKRRQPAAKHLTEAKRIFLQFGATPILQRVESALAELGE